jgi:hypothetical protein
LLVCDSIREKIKFAIKIYPFVNYSLLHAETYTEQNK